jgi:hypothetical protein
MEQKNKQELVNIEQNGGFIYPEMVFATPKVEEKPAEAPKPVATGEDVVEKLFNAAVVETVANNTEIQEQIVDSAKETIQNKTQAIKDKAIAESKKAYFESNEGACDCFGFTEKSTEKWAVTLMTIWHRVMTAIWIVLGFFTYAPVTFIAKKLSVIIKRTWIAVFVAALIYVLTATSPIWLSWFNSIGV